MIHSSIAVITEDGYQRDLVVCLSWFIKHGAVLHALCRLIPKVKGNEQTIEQWVEHSTISVYKQGGG